jgi:hypothetical protein
VNSEPHSHQILIDGCDPGFNWYYVRYGDTTVEVSKIRLFRKRRLRRGIRKAIDRHDRGSQGHVSAPGRAASEVLAAMPVVPADQWASSKP